MRLRNFFAGLLAVAVLLSCLPASLAEGETAYSGEEFFIPEDEEIVVDELIDVDDLMIDENLDDEGWWNILLLGGDSRADGKYGRSDAIIILSVNPTTGNVKLSSIMRDTWVSIYQIGQNKINAANVYGGPELVMRTVNESFGMNIQHYALVDMRAFLEIVDILGGIPLDITERELYFLNEQLYYNNRELGLGGYTKLDESGEGVLLDGNQALAYVRLRHVDSDYVRTGRQRAALVSIAKKLQNEGTLSTVASVIIKLIGYVETNLNLTQLMELCAVGFNIDMDSIEQMRLPVDGTFESGYFNEVWCIKPDFKKNEELLHDFIYGNTTVLDEKAGE